MRAELAQPSVAALLDEVRSLVVAARDRGQSPSYLMLASAAYDAVAACRAPDRRIGAPMTVLGLEIVRSDDSAAPPRVF